MPRREVDHVITTRELAALIKERGWDYPTLQEEEFDEFLGIGTGAAAIFGTTGGVMEAALRCAAGRGGTRRVQPVCVPAGARGAVGIPPATQPCWPIQCCLSPTPGGYHPPRSPLHRAAPHRTVYDMASGEQLPRLQLSEVRGLDGVKEASVTIRANPEGPLKNTEVRRAAEGAAARLAALGGPARWPDRRAAARMHACCARVAPGSAQQ